MKITTDQVLHVARLARLEFTAEEAEKFSGQMGAILDYVEKLNELDLDGVEPMAHVHDLANVTREDEVRSSFTNERALKNAPDSEGGCFKVAKIIEEA